MKLKDIIRPWSALRAARTLTEALVSARAQDRLAYDDFCRRMKLHSDAQAETIRRLRELARKGAYHDPKTGRMMKRGVIPPEYRALVDVMAANKSGDKS